MPQITTQQPRITQINVFVVKPENQQALIALLVESAHAVRHIPGWISASIHKNQDGTRVVNYAQCESMEAWHRIMDVLRQGGFLERNKQLAEAHPGLYEVVATLES